MKELQLLCFIFLVVLSFSSRVFCNELSRTAWAKNMNDDSVKAIFIAPYGALQDAHELMLRFDIDGMVVPVSNSDKPGDLGLNGYYWPELQKSDRSVLEDVSKALSSKWDVLVLSSVPDWSKYPAAIRKRIIDTVVNGESLIVTALSPALFNDLREEKLKLTKLNIPQEIIPFAKDEVGRMEAYSVGKGKILVYDTPNDKRMGYLLSNSTRQADFELSAARSGQLIRWVAARKYNRMIQGIIDGNDKLTVKVTSMNHIADKLMLHLNVRRVMNYNEIFSKKLPLDSTGNFEIHLPYLPSGDYQAEMVLKNIQDKTYDWTAIRFTIRRPISIKSVTLDKSSCASGENIKCHIQSEGGVENLKVRLRWFDQWNRLLSETEFDSLNDVIAIRAPKNSLSVLNYVEVVLISPNGPEALGEAEILMPANVRPADDFYVLYWNSALGNTWRQRLYYDVLRNKGMADAFANCDISENHARNATLMHMRTIPYATAFHNVTLAEQLMNDEWLREMEHRASVAAKNHGKYSALAYTLGDENYVSAFNSKGRFSNQPEVWEMFRDYLKETYQDIASLNFQWNTSYKNWNDIYFKNEKVMLTDFDNPSAWMDYRTFVSRKLASAYTKMRKAIQSEDADAVVGWDGCEQFSSYDGYDWWELTRDMELINVYHTYIIPYQLSNKIFNGEAVKSFRAKTALSGSWLNGTDIRYGGEYVPWYLVLNGWNSVWWWYGTFIASDFGACQWNLELHSIVSSMSKAAASIKNGPATMLAHSEKQLDPIVVHYSANNFNASTIESGIGNHINNLGFKNEFWMADELVGQHVKADDEMKELWGGLEPKGHYAASAKNFYLLFHDLGFTPQTMARQQIESDELAKAKIKVLVLPFVVSLSNKEVEKIRKFVEDGGVLIADYRCGLRDLHGKIRTTPALDEVFGIQRKNFNANRQKHETVFHKYPYRFEEAKIPTTFHDTISATNASANGIHDDGMPALMINKYGKGMAVYLNSDIYEYDRLRKNGMESDFRELFRDILIDVAKLHASFVPEYKFGHPLDAVQTTRFFDGQTLYFGILPDFSVNDKSSRQASLRFPKNLYIYDVRRHICLGLSDEPIIDVIEPGQPKMYAALPYEITGIQIKGPEQLKVGDPAEFTISIEGSVAKLGPHTVRINVEYPDGKTAEHFSQTIYYPNGQGTFRLNPALNEPVGQWKIHAVEAISAKEAIKNFKVIP